MKNSTGAEFMQLEIYLQETKQLTEYNAALLEETRQRLAKGEKLSKLEQSGVLHTLQILIENAIGKAKHTLKSQQKNIPISAYDTFEALAEIGVIPTNELKQWLSIIGLRNKIVHDDMNIDFSIILQLIKEKQYEIIISFLLQPIVE